MRTNAGFYYKDKDFKKKYATGGVKKQLNLSIDLL